MKCANTEIFSAMRDDQWVFLAEFLGITLDELLNMEAVATLEAVVLRIERKYGLASTAVESGRIGHILVTAMKHGKS